MIWNVVTGVISVDSTPRMILELEAAAARGFKVLGYRLSTNGVDAAAALGVITFERPSTDSGDAGSSPTPVAIDPRDSAEGAASMTVRHNHTTLGTPGAIIDRIHLHPNGGVQEFLFPFGQEIVVPAAGRFSVQGSFAASVGVICKLIVED